MSKPKRQRHVHEFWGEFDSLPVTQWLNGKNRPAGDPIEKLVRLAAAIPSPGLRDVPSEIERTVSRLVRHSQLAVAPALSDVTATGWKVKWNLVGNINPSQGLALIKLLGLAERGLLTRVRKCSWPECGLWFFARFEHQHFHGARCQQRAARSTEEWKASRREYMKRLRRETKQREQRQQRLLEQRKRARARSSSR